MVDDNGNEELIKYLKEHQYDTDSIKFDLEEQNQSIIYQYLTKEKRAEYYETIQGTQNTYILHSVYHTLYK